MSYVYKEAVKHVVTHADVVAAKNELTKLKQEALEARTALAVKLDKIRHKTAAITAWIKRHENRVKDVSDDHDWGPSRSANGGNL